MKTMQHTTKWTKTLATAGLAGILMVSASGLPSAHVHAQAQAASGNGRITAPALAAPLVTSKTLQSTEKWLEADITIPVFQGLADTKYQDQLNDIIDSHAFKDLAKWEQEAAASAALAQKNGYAMHPYQLLIQYELTSDGSDNGLVSLKITTEGAGMNNPDTRIDTYNFTNEAEAKRVTLADLFGNKYPSILDAHIKSAIAADQERYFEGEDGFQGVDPEQSFYVKDGKAYIVFQEYSIAPGSTGTPEFAVKLPDRKEEVHGAVQSIIPSGKHYIGKDGKIMVPLASALRQLQFDVAWNGKRKAADISKGALRSSISLNKDSYFLGKKAPRKLGAAPEMRNGHVYVPLEFLSDILNLKVIQDKHGQITISLAGK
ncbi:stalk domain-containing protein [Paenibacillus sp. FSL M8-0142]|uniref:stalk domain-containing protein n=1 Tax=Paenibacillus sp. FSL M8-0142 TaxID=2954525 RepID=UPI00315ABC72